MYRGVLCTAIAGVAAAGGGGGGPTQVPYCHDPDSFLGVANAQCLAANEKTTFMLLGLIVVVSIYFETLIHHLKHKYADQPQLMTLLEHVIEELMILGFISMSFFVMNTVKISGTTITAYLSRFNPDMGPTELFHFKEFFHYLIFLAMMYYLLIVFIMICSSHKLPRLWDGFEAQLKAGDEQKAAAVARASEQAQKRASRAAAAGRQSLLAENPVSSSSSSEGSDFLTALGASTAGPRPSSGGAAVNTYTKDLERNIYVQDTEVGEVPVDQVTEDYCQLKETRRMYGWRVKANPMHWCHWWLLVNRMAYKLARESSREVYEDRELIEVAFSVPMYSNIVVDYSMYALLSTRAVLIKMCEIHWSAWALLLVFVIINEFRVRLGGTKALHEDDDETVQSVIMCGFLLFSFALLLCAKTFQVLQGIVNDRVLIFYRNGKIQRLVLNSQEDNGIVEGDENSNPALSRLSAGTATQRRNSSAVAKKRLKTLDFHCRRFWFGKPKLLVRMLTFVTFFTAIFMAVLSLMFVTIGKKTWGGGGLVMMMMWPALICFVILPTTLPVLAHTLDLCGYIGADQLEKLQHRHDHAAHSHYSEKRGVHFCPFCGAGDLVMQNSRMRCALCGTEGIASKVKVQSKHAHDIHRHSRSAGTAIAMKAMELGGRAVAGSARATGKAIAGGAKLTGAAVSNAGKVVKQSVDRAAALKRHGLSGKKSKDAK